MVGMVGSMTAISLAKAAQSTHSSVSSSSITMQAQNYAASKAELLKSVSYSDLQAQTKADILNSGFKDEVVLSNESDYSSNIKQKTATIKIFKGNEALPRASLNLTRYSVEQKAGGVPVGTIIAWASTKNPTDGTWLECNGQSCSKYAELVNILGKNNVPDYRGVFLRGYGTKANNGISHSSGSLGAFQNMAFPETMSGTFCAVNTDGPAPTGPFSQIGSYKDYGLQDNTGYGGGYNKQIKFDLSRVVPTGNELRPVNIAVRYLIKAA